MKTASFEAPPTLFQWESPRSNWRPLTWFVVGSLAMHALCFYLFRISYPPAVGIAPAPPQLQFINAATEEGRALLQWAEAEDPALASSTMRPPEQKNPVFPELRYSSAYENRVPALKLPPMPELHGARTDPFPPGPVPAPIASPPKESVPVPTTVTFGPELGAQEEPVAAGAPFVSRASGAPANVAFYLAIDRNGRARFIFLTGTSGDTALDQEAYTWLAQRSFPQRNSGEGMLWTTALFQWGNDLASAPARR